MPANPDALWRERSRQQTRLIQLIGQRRHLWATTTNHAAATPQDLHDKAQELDYLIARTRERITELGNQWCDTHAPERQPC